MLAKYATPCKHTRAFRSTKRSVVCQAYNGFTEKLKATAAAVILSSGLVVAPAVADGVSISNIKSGATVASPVHLVFQVEGMSVKPAAEGVIPGTGHHHIIIDGSAPPAGAMIPFDDTHKHFGKGQTSVDLELPSGNHTLTLQFANAVHESYGPTFAKSITVNVQ